MTEPTLEGPSARLLEGLYAAYYKTSPNLDINNPAHREWMLVDFEGRTHRHLQFDEIRHLRAELDRHTPLHVYHSVAQYRDATPQDMAELRKRWERADLLLDVDCKPGPPPEGDGYANLNAALTAAKVYALRALHILKDELAVPARDYEITFSGSKGYHVRLVGPWFQKLSDEERRELAAYLSGAGARLEHLFPGIQPGAVSFPKSLPGGGLRRRIAIGLRQLETMARSDPPSPRFVEILERAFAGMSGSGERILALLRANGLAETQGADANVHAALVAIARELTCPRLDMRVVGNVVGMVRTPNTINGKTGLLCKRIPDEEGLLRFDPIEDASPFARLDPLRLEGRVAQTLATRDQTYSTRPGEVAGYPASVGVIFLSGGSAVPATG